MTPVGMGTGLVESATGYSSRLALAHNVTLAVLFGYEIAPLLNKNHLRNSEARTNKNAVLSSSFRTLAPAVEGHGITAETYIASLQKLTMRDDLRFLTMLPWKEVISHRRLTRPKRVWCPACYYEWRGNGAIMYEPLLWSLAVVTVCIRHRQRLHSLCHRCGQELRLLASRSQPGYCEVCRAWLGEPTQSESLPKELLTADELEWQSWIYEQTCKLLAAAPTLNTPPSRSLLAESIRRRIRVSECKTELAFAQACGISQSSVNDLCRGTCVPQLSTLLRISFVGRISTVDLILGRTFEADVGMLPHRLGNNQPPAEKVAAQARHRMAGRPKHIARSFKRLLKTNPPLPMAEIEKRLGIHRQILWSRFSDLYGEAVTRYRAHTEKCRREFWEDVRETLEKQLTEKVPLSVAGVAREVGRSRKAVVSRFPELCVKVYDHWVERGKERWKAIEAFLRNSLENTLPLRLRDIAKQLGLSHTSLYSYFPQLCAEIAKRYALHLQQRRALKKESLQDEVRRIAKSLHEQGVYPSVREVSKHLAKPMSLRSNKAALISLREVRLEL